MCPHHAATPRAQVACPPNQEKSPFLGSVVRASQPRPVRRPTSPRRQSQLHSPIALHEYPPCLTARGRHRPLNRPLRSPGVGNSTRSRAAARHHRHRAPRHPTPLFDAAAHGPAATGHDHHQHQASEPRSTRANPPLGYRSRHPPRAIPATLSSSHRPTLELSRMVVHVHRQAPAGLRRLEPVAQTRVRPQRKLPAPTPQPTAPSPARIDL